MRDCLNALENGLDVEELSDYEIGALHEFSHVARQIASYESRIDNVIEEYEQITE